MTSQNSEIDTGNVEGFSWNQNYKFVQFIGK